MRVCQPAPPARNRAMMSASRRMVVEVFGEAAGGRPRRTGVASNLAVHSGVERSGASSGSIQSVAIALLFSVISFSQAFTFATKLTPGSPSKWASQVSSSAPLSSAVA